MTVIPVERKYVQYLNLLRAGIPYLSPDNSAGTDANTLPAAPRLQRRSQRHFVGVNIHERGGAVGAKASQLVSEKNERRKESNGSTSQTIPLTSRRPAERSPSDTPTTPRRSFIAARVTH